MAESQWYVLKVLRDKEKDVKTLLEAKLADQKLKGCIEQILIPYEKVYEMRAGKRKVKEKNFFPSYVLINADLSDGRVTHLIRDIPGVLGFLSDRGWGVSKTPVPVREAEINRILGKVDEVEETTADLEKSFNVGDTVRIVDGPFSGFMGNVQEVFEERKKLNVAVKIFERNTRMELSYPQVEAVYK